MQLWESMNLKNKEKLRNIGPVTYTWLNTIGIYTKGELERIGAEQAYKLLQQAGYPPTQNCLYALIGAVHDMDWKDVAYEMKKKT